MYASPFKTPTFDWLFKVRTEPGISAVLMLRSARTGRLEA